MTLDAQSEFAKAMLKIQPTMINPFAGRDKKRKALAKAVDSLSEHVFTLHVPQIIEIINKKKDVCEEYPDAEAQVEGILRWLPRMKAFSDLLLAVISEHRSKYNLKV